MAQLKQRYIDGLSTLEVYEEASERQEIEHLKTLASLYEDGSTEQLNIQKQLQDKLFSNQRSIKRSLKRLKRNIKRTWRRLKNRCSGTTLRSVRRNMLLTWLF